MRHGSAANFHFVFIVDRSGSMGMFGRMELAKEALALFIRSLPKDSKFSIISFGSRHQVMVDDTQSSVLTLTDESKREALSQIQSFKPTLGGTNILGPLRYAQEKLTSGLQKRIFLLTDGQVDDAQLTIAQAQRHNDSCRVFSFGLGSECDKYLVVQVANAGRGTSTIVRDSDANLNGLVILALATAMEPSLRNTTFGFSLDSMSKPLEVYRNTLISATKLMTEAEFENLEFFFKTEADGD